MFALNPKPRLKPRFVLTVRQYDWAGHCPSNGGIFCCVKRIGDIGTCNLLSIERRQAHNGVGGFLNEFSLLRLGTVVFMSSTPFSQDLNGFAIQL
jgi:hypothetical protein